MAMSGAERMRRYRARKKGTPGFPKLKPGPKKLAA